MQPCRPTLLGLALILLAAGLIEAQQSRQRPPQPAPHTQSKCPPNTFTCKDGSCIPEDWVGDGEPDCDDQSDETGEEPADMPSHNMSTKPPRTSAEVPVPSAPRVQTEEPRETEAPARTMPAHAATMDMQCPAEHHQRVMDCAQPVKEIVDQVARIDLHSEALLHNSDNVDMLDRVCELVAEYSICSEGTSTACPVHPLIQQWKDVEMYVCQLLVPSVREHSTCFQKKRDGNCSVSISPSDTPLCRLVTSVIQDVGCLDRFGDCASEAKEMLIPIQMESEHIAKEIRCTMPELIPMPAPTQRTPHREEEMEETEEDREAEAEKEKETDTEMTADEDMTEKPETHENATQKQMEKQNERDHEDEETDDEDDEIEEETEKPERPNTTTTMKATVAEEDEQSAPEEPMSPNTVKESHAPTERPTPDFENAQSREQSQPEQEQGEEAETPMVDPQPETTEPKTSETEEQAQPEPDVPEPPVEPPVETTTSTPAPTPAPVEEDTDSDDDTTSADDPFETTELPKEFLLNNAESRKEQGENESTDKQTDGQSSDKQEEDTESVAPESHGSSEDTTVTPTTEATTTTTEENEAPMAKTKPSHSSATDSVKVLPPLSDAVRSLSLISSVCDSQNRGDVVFGRLHSLLCSKKQEIESHRECFEKTLTKNTCEVKPASDPCQAIEAFNANLDCAIVLMNDECDVDAQDYVVGLQEQVNDLAIEAQCFQGPSTTPSPNGNSNDGFALNSTLPRCTDQQENSALACLVELVEINKQLALFQNQNFLLELANENSSIVSGICSMFGKYESCLSASVFSLAGGQRCSFASPLNTLARIGLGPLCAPTAQPLLSEHKECLIKLSRTPSAVCASGLGGLGGAVQKMMQGIHAEALLCKSFYVIRETFECGEKQVAEHCESGAVDALRSLQTQMNTIGVEEGCPEVPPSDLDEIIAKPVQRPVPAQVPVPKRVPVPAAHPLTPPTPVVPTCTNEQQKKFQECVKPMTVYQPHPLSVIKMPRQIDEACEKFTEFKQCTADIDCHPLWAKGMSAMFEFACGEGSASYKEVRQCVRKVASEETVKQCVGVFSRGAPQQACFSANTLLSCAMPLLQTHCGQPGVDFVVNYVTKFASAIDPQCKLASQIPIGRVVGVSCSMEEQAVIDHCAAPLNDIGSRMEEMFQGGLNALIKNANMLAPVFAGGCNLTDEFRACAAGPLQGRTSCIVSNCMVKAGEDICRLPDPVKAIDDHLSCLFGQVQDPVFAKCVRSTLSTVQTFTLNAFRAVLPKFVDCVQEVVVDKCGNTPLKVLRAISSPDLCPLGPGSSLTPLAPISNSASPIPQQGGNPVQNIAVASAVPTPARHPEVVQPITCTDEVRAQFDSCAQTFFSKYRILPIALLNEVDNMDQVCHDVTTFDQCAVVGRVCMNDQQKALRAVTMQICASRAAFEPHKICLKNVANKSSCMSQFLSASTEETCMALQTAASCMAPQAQSECGAEAVQYSFLAMADYGRQIDSKCKIEQPVIAVETSSGCSEDDYVQLLGCETNIDKFGFRPVSIISDGSQWDQFCSTIASTYKPCVEKMKCKFEPATTANLGLFDSICNREITLRDQKQHGVCLSTVMASTEGQQCAAPFSSLDLVAKDTQTNICKVLNSVLSCASPIVEKQCGFDALLHVFDLHIQYSNAFDSSCIIQSPEPTVTEPATTTTEKPMEAEAPTTMAPTIEQPHPKDIRVKATSSLSTLSASLCILLLLLVR